ncbi:MULTISPECIES: lipase secretion chaperone [Acinetobacter]|uniref:lipase secretion chaperone n=1 Tax=Acinetobacter TaxID=469 RepID=UPI00141BAE55|nr:MULTISPECIES: lipase secretion chaperone [Acinetobacter]MCS4299150.1 lipase chaperone LimK [Acinetobacter guillouiae]MCW2250203.1 lipase chaperone LimK [Acinetobacter sp. BIGb0204]NII39306.1 lipase chaperone LimK [Acinetobacter sp. BIGb0196]
MKNKLLLILVFFLIVIGIFTMRSMGSKSQTQQEDKKSASSNIQNTSAINNQTIGSMLKDFIPLGTDAFGNNIQCSLSFDSDKKLILDNLTKDCFDKLLNSNRTAMGTIEFGLNYFSKILTEPSQTLIGDLWKRYVQYVNSTMSLHRQFSTLLPSTENVKKLNQAVRSLRISFFTSVEIKALFSDQDKMEDYELSILEIQDSPNLSKAEINHRVDDAINRLPEKSREALKFNKKFNELNHEIQNIKNRSGSELEIKEARLNAVGPEITERMEVVDQQRRKFKDKVDLYIENRNNILNSNLASSEEASAINSLRDRSFTDLTENRRVKSLEKIYDETQSLDVLN